ncbi:Adenylosuccinate lyase [Gemmata obscuriglobus]|uniref:Adenylosuccinate lyase n=1 Tax=Gemmata obscuriglobus TaxID=114 RepID=A0A2Z3H376_9BACT|nr:adenylosuccinate lyase [Gemmata obscuriglobus]AWM38026.1 adenylosuccinate lyase [Gemmata obscuriglobus]QEG29105.1 Adenylosuccinate lyase [Gemmata obscuriglobus]VTS07785.1 adenylosuccinate lyase : Adenylosuccinate lyase OS=uncultured planctomycete GN=HGMM_F33C03C06 PE=3 SV=1: Lyase_1: ADSL_C [Gemmata obscuriglobus UQM 2246]
MNETNDVYDNPLIGRYASAEMAERWGPLRKFRTWRRLWLALAEAEAELGLLGDDGQPRITPAKLAELRAHLDDIDLKRAAAHEKRLRHDVMAQVHALKDVAPGCGDIVHLGATSCYVTDNADLILMREGLNQLCESLACAIDALATFATTWKDEPTLGFTHFQPAQLTTVGKRATLWLFDFVLDLQELERRRDELPFRGAKGTTGTQASFLALFNGDHDKVRRLDALVAKKMGFDRVFPVTGQTYSRKIDSQILDALNGLAQSAHKWGTDLRLLAHRQEVDEPFEAEQIGSSAMAYKRNPMRAERMCSLARFISGLPAMAADTASTQWFERTLDDSACRRLYIPQAFLATDAVLRIALNVLTQKSEAGRGLVVNKPIIAKNVREYLPYMATENLMMAAVQAGEDRQVVHEIVRQHSHAVTARVKSGEGSPAELFALLKADKSDAFKKVDFGAVTDPKLFVGRSPEQVEEFVGEHVAPIRARYAGVLGKTAELHV